MAACRPSAPDSTTTPVSGWSWRIAWAQSIPSSWNEESSSATQLGADGDRDGLPNVLVIMTALIALYGFVTTRTVIGRHIYAIGGNVEVVTEDALAAIGGIVKLDDLGLYLSRRQAMALLERVQVALADRGEAVVGGDEDVERDPETIASVQDAP